MSEVKNTDVVETDSTLTEEMVPDFNIEVGDVQITKERVISAVRAVLMLITTLGTMFGFAFDADFVYQITLCVLMIVSLVWGYWKNNNWTVNAVVAQQVKNSLKNDTYSAE